IRPTFRILIRPKCCMELWHFDGFLDSSSSFLSLSSTSISVAHKDFSQTVGVLVFSKTQTAGVLGFSKTQTAGVLGFSKTQTAGVLGFSQTVGGLSSACE
ncbi:hypothetical protein KUCAC02_017276, partial [Chaenocephalus aceratus]